MSKSRQGRRTYPAQPRRSPSPPAGGHRTLIFCKPYKVLSSFTDPEGHVTLSDYIDVPGVYAAGRLDYDSEGLLLLTSDGWLAHRITQPKYKLKKTYLVQVENIPTEAALNQLRQGVVVQGERTRPAEVELLAAEPDIFPRSEPIRYRPTIPTTWLKIGLREGRKRQIRRMTAAVGHPTLRLIRTAIGPITLGQLIPGQWRDLTPAELKTLKQSLTS
ncbi:MAG: pseudouridine synthase [Anaerolineales bacterium]|nr:pseudouridine synthase [Anaerolineales bacterium]